MFLSLKMIILESHLTW